MWSLYHGHFMSQDMIRQEGEVMSAYSEETYGPDLFSKSGAGVLNVKMED